MEGICSGIGIADTFHHNATSLFVVYAHDTELESADSRVVREIIKYLKLSGTLARSDRVPVLPHYSEDPESEARDDILVNQFCLLPEKIAINPVKKVLLCYSNPLHKYFVDADGNAYIKQVKDAALSEMEKLREGASSTITLNSQGIQGIQKAIRDVVNKYTRKPWFHHVLTEIALVELRVILSDRPCEIIPVDLQSTDMILKDLSFLNPTQHYVVPPPMVVVKFDDSERTHRLFFLLLERIHGQLSPVIIWLKEIYDRGVEKLHDNRNQADVVFRNLLNLEIMEELRRAQSGGLRGTSRSDRPQPETGEQTWDIPFFKHVPAKPVKVPADRIPADLLGPSSSKQRGMSRFLFVTPNQILTI